MSDPKVAASTGAGLQQNATALWRRVERHALDALRRRKRARAAKKKAIGRRLALGLTVILAVLLATFGWSLFYLFGDDAPNGTRKVTIDEARNLVDQGRVQRVTFLDEDNLILGHYTATPKPPVATPTPGKPATPAPAAKPAVTNPLLPDDSPVNKADESGDFQVAIPQTGQLTSQLEQAFRNGGARVTVDQQPTKQRVRQVSTFLLPLMILANLFALLFSLGRQSTSAIGEVMTFGTIGKGKVKKGMATVSFDDVGGAEEAVAELREVRDYLTDPAKYEALGAAPPKGVLLFGPPGCGKTLLAKAVAGEAGVPFFSVAGAEFVESLVGVGAARVRDLFQRVRAAAPAIVFIDELDAAGRKRGTGGGGGGSDEREQTLNQLLVEMDGFEVSTGIVVMGATNRPDILDPALMRPGRFDRHITIERPELDGRLRILEIHAKGKPLGGDVDLERVAKRTPGFTGADLANVVNEATLLTIRETRDKVTQADFEEAIQRVLSGPKRRGRVLSEEERKRTAYHESGHVIVAAAAGAIEDVHRVSILARGRAVATTQMNKESEASLLSASQLRGQLVTLLAGISAETLIFGEASTGGEQDLEQATDLARDMVARYGMSAALGPMRLLAKTSEGYLGSDIPLADISSETQAAIDNEIRRLVAEAQADATALLARHRKTLDNLAARLDEEETLEGVVLHEVLAPIQIEMSTEHIGASRKVRSPANGSRGSRAKVGTRR